MSVFVRSGFVAYLLVGILAGSLAVSPSFAFGGNRKPKKEKARLVEAPSDDRAVLLWEAEDSGGRRLDPIWLPTVNEALREVAYQAEVVVCFDHDLQSTDPSFRETCLNGELPRNELWWKADIKLTDAGGFESLQIALTLEFRTPHKRVKRQSGQTNQFVTGTNVVVPPERSDEERFSLLAAAVKQAIFDMPGVYHWFASLVAIPEFLVERPPAPPIDPSIWEAEEDRITDLMIDGQYYEAMDRAEALLEEEALPANIADRVIELFEKAEEKIRERDVQSEGEPASVEEAEVAIGAGGEEVVTLEQSEPESEPELEYATPPPPPPRPFDFTYPVSLAEAGSGFLSGIDGKLLVSDRGLRFVPEDSAHGKGWLVRWSSFKRAGRAEGLWDVSYPLEIELNDGTKYYVVEANPETGRYQSGEQILAKISEGRRRNP